MTSWRQRWQALGPCGCGFGLLIALFVAYLLSLPIAISLSGAAGAMAAATAAGLCWLGTAAALLVFQFAARRMQPAMAMLTAMGARMVLPLALGLLLQELLPALSGAGFMYYLIVFYQVALFLETLWFVARIEATSVSEMKGNGDHG